MRITHVEAIPYSVPVQRVARFASGVREHADHVLVRVHTDDGLVGQAEAQPRPYSYGETQASIVTAVREQLGPALAGLYPIAIERAAERCSRLRHNNVARAAVDLAIWDLVGKILERPCRELLGGYAPDVAAAHTVSYDEPRAMADEALEYHERLGVRTFKLKVGRNVELDLAACAAIRDALPSAELYVDANQGWSYAQAVRAGDALIELGVDAIEEPIQAGDRDGRRRLAERWSVPMIGDESCISLTHVARSLDDGARPARGDGPPDGPAPRGRLARAPGADGGAPRPIGGAHRRRHRGAPPRPRRRHRHDPQPGTGRGRAMTPILVAPSILAADLGMLLFA